MSHDNGAPQRTSTAHRVLTGAMGLIILGSGVYALRLVSSSGRLQLLGSILLIVLGTNMIASALHARESWLSQIGPLP